MKLSYHDQNQDMKGLLNLIYASNPFNSIHWNTNAKILKDYKLYIHQRQ